MDSDYCIGVPARNEAVNILSLLKTLLGQTVAPVKIVVCVNGTTDDSFEIASKFAKENPTIEVVRSDPGKANAWHEIIKHVSTDKILFCDGDILMDENAAEKLLQCLDSDKDLILAGGTAWSINEKKSFFAKYFVAAESEAPEPKWVIGRLYMLRLEKLKARLDKLDVELMPRDTINDDGYLELMTSGHNILTKEAFVTSAGVDSFSDWRHRYVRILAGQKELESRYGNLLLPDNAHNQTAKEKEKSTKNGRVGRILRDLRFNYDECKHIDSFRERMGIMSMAFVKIAINFYYKIVGGPYCKTTWTEAKSTKKELKSQKKIAIVSIAPGGGWNTVRKRWEKHFGKIKDADFGFYHIENYARWVHKLTVEKHRLRSLWYLAAGRAAAKQAIKDGYETILIDTYHYAAWAPLCKNVRYFMYGDATARQLTALRPLETNKDAKLPWFIDWLYRKGIERLSRAATIFLGMSNWYLQGLKEECAVPDEQLVELPFGLDVKHWQKQELKADALPKKGFEILFLGDPFEEKGGYILQDVAKMSEFSECKFHFVGRTVNFKDEGNCHYYNHLQADSSELLQLFSRCDLMILPTYSDFSPNAAIEALAMSMPVIITDVAAISDIVKDGETGRLLAHPPRKEEVRVKLLEYMNDPELLKKESIAARKRAEEKFNIDIHMERLYNLLTAE